MTSALLNEIDRADRIAACWVGKSIGGALGMPYEGQAGPIEIDTTTSDLTPVPNDDLELQLLWLHALEQDGFDDVLGSLQRAWLSHQAFHVDEYAVALQNLRRGIAAPVSGLHGNWFEHGMGAAIRSEIWACLSPDDPETAATLAHIDACVDHHGEGVNAERLLAALQSLGLAGVPLRDAIKQCTNYIDQGSQFVPLVRDLLHLTPSELAEPKVVDQLDHRLAHHNFTDCVMNVGYILWALLAGGGDFERTLRLAVTRGQDTDCTAATAGATLGLFHGLDSIPIALRERATDGIVVSDHLQGLGLPSTLDELTHRVTLLAEKFAHSAQRQQIREPAMSAHSTVHDNVAVRAAILDSVPSASPSCFADAMLENPDVGQTLLARELGRGIALEPVLDGRAVADVVVAVGIHLDVELDGWLMVAAEAGSTAWLNGKLMLDYHGRRSVIPAIHRTEGGATVPIHLEAGVPYRIGIRLLGVQRHTRLYLQLAHADRSLVTQSPFYLPQIPTIGNVVRPV